jgi:hypothetical protein
MKKIFVFGGHSYHPKGGMCDFIESFETIEQAQIFVDNSTIGVRMTKLPLGSNGGFYTKQLPNYTWGDWVSIIDISEKL